MQASPQPEWRRSSHSGGGNNCVEAAQIGAAVAVRDSKNSEGRPVTLPSSAWRALIGQMKDGEFDL